MHPKRFWKIFFVGAILTFVISELTLALVSHFDSYDGYLFITQSRRVTDSVYAGSPLMMIRPRGLIVALNAFEVAAHAIQGKFPSLVGYHLFTLGICLVFFFVALRLVAK